MVNYPNELIHLWKRTISSIVCTGLFDNAALIKHSTYANEKLLPWSSMLYNEVDEDGGVSLIAKLM